MKSPAPTAHAIILAGGRGTRFWPRSRTRTPKQLLNIVGHNTMLEQTVARLSPLFSASRKWVVTNSEQAAAVRSQLPAVPVAHSCRARRPQHRSRDRPCRRASAAAEESSGDALMAVLPADQFIAKPARYRQIVRAALARRRCSPDRWSSWAFRRRGRKPATATSNEPRATRAVSHPPSDAVYPVRRFTEKPALALARKYVASGRYLWNAGMFFWRVSTFLETLRRVICPKTHAALMRLAETSARRATPRSCARIYPQLENISVDYAILEPASRDPSRSRVFVLPAAIGWSDIGSWAAVYELLAPKRRRKRFRREVSWRSTRRAIFSGARKIRRRGRQFAIWSSWKRPTRCCSARATAPRTSATS